MKGNLNSYVELHYVYFWRIKVKRCLSILIAGLLLISSSPVGINSVNANENTIQRFFGLDRYKTAKRIAEEVNKGQTENIILASGNNFPDALSSSVLAYQLKAPILLVDTSAASSVEAFEYIKEHLSPSGSIYMTGGISVIGKDFRVKLNQMGYVDTQIFQLGGSDRYETSVRIAETLNTIKGTPVILVTGTDFKDALAISSFAAYEGWPMLLIGEYVPSSVEQYLKNIQPSKIYIVGSSSSVSPNTEKQVRELLPSTQVERLAGNDEFSTGAIVMKKFAPDPRNVYIASGSVFADALSGSILAAQTSSPIILVDPTSTNPPTVITDYLKSLKKPNIYVFGGEGAIPNPLLESIQFIVDPENIPIIKPYKLNVKEISGVGNFNTYQMANNLTVETNLNMELLDIMAALGSGFNHKGYPIDTNETELNQRVRNYFNRYIGNSTSKTLYDIEVRNSGSGPSKKFSGKATLGMLRTGEFLQGNLLYPDIKFFRGSILPRDEVSLEQLNTMVQKFADETIAIDFFKQNANLYNIIG